MTISKLDGSAAIQPLQGNAIGKMPLQNIETKQKVARFEGNASGNLPKQIQLGVDTYAKFLTLKSEIKPSPDQFGLQGQNGIKLKPPGRSNAVPLTPMLLVSTPSVVAKQARVVVEGVSVPRFQPQEAMSKRYTEAELTKLGISPKNTRIYVLDDFVNANIPMGVDSRSNAVNTTHGDVVAGIVSATLKGKGEVIRLNVGEKKVDGKTEEDKSTQDFIRQINHVIETEAKRQNKTASTVDLSQVTINASWSFPDSPSTKEVSAAVSKFTSRGGHFFAGAGNDSYSSSATVFPNTNIVDGSNLRVGQDIPTVQKPWSQYKNEAVDAKGNDVRSKRPLDATSRSIIAPSKLETRVMDGAIEFRDDSNPKGWSKLVDASATTMSALPAPKAGGLAGLKPQKLTSAKHLDEFIQRRSDAYEEALKNAKNTKAELPSDLTPAELAAFQQKVAVERKRLIGDQPVMTLSEYLKHTGKSPDSLPYQQALASIPNGLTPEQVVVSADQVMESSERSSLQYYVLDKNGLKPIQPNNSTTITNGTSWATPYAAANHAIWQREQVAAAKAAADKL